MDILGQEEMGVFEEEHIYFIKFSEEFQREFSANSIGGILNNANVGHHGPHVFDAESEPGLRNRYIPRNRQ